MASADKAQLLRRLANLNGASCALIGVSHVFYGADKAPGLGPSTSASEDSQEAFYGGVFAAYGAAWLYATRQQPMSPTLVRFLAGTMALGGAGRIVSIRRRGLPHPFWVTMAAVEFVVPGLFFWLADADTGAATD